MENLDLILSSIVIIISAIVFARRGQISLIRELILSLSYADGISTDKIYNALPKLTKLLVSEKKVENIINQANADNT